MVTLHPPSGLSAFMVLHLPDFFDRFGVSFCIDGPQLEYFIYQKKTGLDISCSLTVSYDEMTKQITVMTFYPGLYLHPETRFFSAVCFFMVTHHFAMFHHIECDCQIILNTKRDVFDSFYALLKDFDFHLLTKGKKDQVNIQSLFPFQIIDVSMFSERALTYELLN